MLDEFDMYTRNDVLLHLKSQQTLMSNEDHAYPPALISVLIHENLINTGILIERHGKALNGMNVAGEVCYTFTLVIEEDEKGELNFSELTELLKDELNAHSVRPAKIMIPISMYPKGTQAHSVLLVIEPDAKIFKKANITLVNPHGNALSSYHAAEKLILGKIKELYSHPLTTTTRNEKKAFTGPFCAIDCIENALLLSTIPDVQSYIINKKLPSRSPEEIYSKREQHHSVIQKTIKMMETVLCE